MTIKTKANVAQQICYMQGNKVVKATVYQIKVFVAEAAIQISYWIGNAWLNEEQIFLTPKELRNTLTKAVTDYEKQ